MPGYCAKMMSSTKPEVHIALTSYHQRIEWYRQHAVNDWCDEDMFLICATDIQTDMLITRLYTPTRVYYSAPDRGVEYCLSVIMSSELHVRFSPTFYACYLWPVAWSSSGSVVICCVFPALWMMDYLQSGLQWACWVFMTSCLHNHSLTTPLPLTRFSARYALLRVLCYFTLKINYKL